MFNKTILHIKCYLAKHLSMDERHIDKENLDILAISILGIVLKYGIIYLDPILKKVSACDFYLSNDDVDKVFETISSDLKINMAISHSSLEATANYCNLISYNKNLDMYVRTGKFIFISNVDSLDECQKIGALSHEVNHLIAPCAYISKNDEQHVLALGLKYQTYNSKEKRCSVTRTNYDEYINSLITLDTLECLAKIDPSLIRDSKTKYLITKIKDNEESLDRYAGYSNRASMLLDLYHNKDYLKLVKKELIDGEVGLINEKLDIPSYYSLLNDLEEDNEEEVRKDVKDLLSYLERKRVC